MTVVGVREREGRRQALPAFDTGVLEGSVHSCEPLGHEVRWEVWMDLENGIGRLGEDPLRPEGPIQLALGDS